MSSERWRVGTKVPINVYEGDIPVCQAQTVQYAKRIVAAVNAAAEIQATREQAERELRMPMKCGHPKACWVEEISDREGWNYDTHRTDYCTACAEQREAVAKAHEDGREEVLTLINTPEIEDFDKAVPLESAHQVIRWGSAHDSGKNPEDWFWLVGYLAGKALASFKSGDFRKAQHHCISTAAALRNWHAHIRSGKSAMRPGIEEPEAERGK